MGEAVLLVEREAPTRAHLSRQLADDGFRIFAADRSGGSARAPRGGASRPRAPGRDPGRCVRLRRLRPPAGGGAGTGLEPGRAGDHGQRPRRSLRPRCAASRAAPTTTSCGRSSTRSWSHGCAPSCDASRPRTILASPSATSRSTWPPGSSASEGSTSCSRRRSSISWSRSPRTPTASTRRKSCCATSGASGRWADTHARLPREPTAPQAQPGRRGCVRSQCMGRGVPPGRSGGVVAPSSQGARGPASLFPQMMASGPPTGAIRVLLADGDRLLARELMRTLSAEERFDVVGCARDGREAVELATSLLPDVVLMGLEMPALDAIEATRRIRARVPSARVLIMGSFDEPDDVDRALAAGAAGFVRRSCASAELVATILGLALVFAFDPTAVARGRAEPPVSAGASVFRPRLTLKLSFMVGCWPCLPLRAGLARRPSGLPRFGSTRRASGRCFQGGT